MAVKYVKDFDYPSEGGFHKSKMPSRAMPNAPARGAARMESKPKMGKGQGYAKGGKVPGREMDKLPAKKPPGRMMDLAPSKPERGQYQGYAKGGKVQKYADGGYTRSGARAPTPQELAYAGRTRIPGAFPMPSELAALQQWAKSQNLSPTQYNRIVNQALRGSQKAAPSLLSRMGKAGALIGTGAALKGLYDEFTMPEDNSQLSPAPDEGMIERRRGGRVSKGKMSKMRRGGKY